MRKTRYSPRFEIHHTSAHEKGQVYIPEINWMLMVATVGLVFGFRTSTNLAAAYCMAVTTTMVITTMLAFVVARERWHWTAVLAGAVAAGLSHLNRTHQLVDRPGTGPTL